MRSMRLLVPATPGSPASIQFGTGISALRPIEDYFIEAIDTVRSNQMNYARAKPARLAGAAPVGFVSECEAV